MHRFWDTIIGPAFEILQPRMIVEVGIDEGLQTSRILEYCTKTGAILHAIDPSPRIEPEEWVRMHHQSLIFHRDLSLNVLGRLHDIDAVLIDGDHNWYTVYHELILLQKQALSDRHFPAVFLHDTGWPYARRDLYYDPERIPEAHRKAYARKGMERDTGMLSDSDGFNPMLFNAVEENALQNGVLTAVEDFLKQSALRLRFVNVPGLHGLGILIPEEILQNRPMLSVFLDGLETGTAMQRHIDVIERERTDLVVSVRIGEKHEREKINVQQRMASISADLQHLRRSRSWRWTSPIRLSEWMIRHVVDNTIRTIIGDCKRVWNGLARPDRTGESALEKMSKQHGTIVLRPDWTAMRHVTVIIPVHNAFDETVRCLASVIAHSHASHRILVVDDASTDPRMEPYLSSLERDHPARVKILKQDHNLGFVQTVNNGMRYAGNDDVILLNNDTIVPSTWVERLQEAAYSRPDAASVIPLSNEASIYSVLRDSIGALLQRFSVADIDRHIERHTQFRLPEIPTSVGFCMFIRRTALEKVGLFDERFGIGYGEENDWCMRTKQAGFRHYLHDGCFVYHVGHVAMKEAGHTQGESSIASHEQLLRSLHPDYETIVQNFLATDTMASIRSHVEKTIGLCTRAQKRIAFILHHPIRSQYIGGIEYHVEDLSDVLRDRYECFVIAPDGDDIVVQSERNGGATERLWRYGTRGGTEQDILNTMEKISRRFSCDIVHVHHTAGLSFAVLPLARAHGASVVYGVHDWLCVHEQTHPLCTEDAGVIDRDTVAKRAMFLQSAHAIVAPSKCVMDIVRSVYGELPSLKRIVPCGIDGKRRIVRPRTDNLTVCFLSYVHEKRKGSALIRELVPRLVRRNIRVVFLGSEANYWPEFAGEPMVEFAGLYERAHVGDRLEAIAAHLVCILSASPETYCYAHDEAWCAGIPVYVTPLGAPAERIRNFGGGRIAPSFNAEAIAEDIAGFLQSEAYDKARMDVENMRITSIADMATAYQGLYEELMTDGASVRAPLSM